MRVSTEPRLDPSQPDTERFNPTAAEIRGLQRVVLAEVGEHTQAGKTAKFLFERAIGGLPPVSAIDTGKACWHDGQFHKDTVRGVVRDLRHSMERISEAGDGTLLVGCRVSRGPYALEFFRTRAANDSVGAFWRPYFAPGAGGIAIYGEPLFFRYGDIYIRVLRRDVTDALAILREVLQPEVVNKLQATTCYGSLGDFLSIRALAREFHARIRTLECATTGLYPRVRGLQDQHVIHVGNVRTNPHIDTMQESYPFALTTTDIEIRREILPGEEHRYADEDAAPPTHEEIAKRAYEIWDNRGRPEGTDAEDWIQADSELKRRVLHKHGLLTRRTNLDHRHCVTIIGANHGRAVLGITEYILSPIKVRELQGLLSASGTTFPREFQAIFRVEIRDYDSDCEIVSVVPIATRVLDATAV